MRECASCGRDLPRSSYTANQYSKPNGISRCAACVHGHPADIPLAGNSDSGRYNKSTSASFDQDDVDNPFSDGAFRWVAKGTYNSGPRIGQACVAKWFKTGAVFETDYFTLDIKAVDKALEIVNTFNELNIVSKTVKINVPAVGIWQSGKSVGQYMLIEPFIKNYQKFNSNTGWSDESMLWGKVMQALSHFSYHLTRGQFVLCDLQGGIYQSSVILSDPVILSRNGEYGVTDLGPRGISSFFSQHECNNFCRSHWTKPANPVAHFRAVAGTTMMRHSVPTHNSRPNRTFHYS
ncbi:kinase-like protein [Jackrogersella minutella]|nr:kinase-like protein [Jackrogersella minutella]